MTFYRNLQAPSATLQVVPLILDYRKQLWTLGHSRHDEFML
jgi:hypothetical protein